MCVLSVFLTLEIGVILGPQLYMPRGLLGHFFYGFVCVGVCVCVCSVCLFFYLQKLSVWTQGHVLVHSCLFYRSMYIRTFIEGLCVKGVHVNSCVFWVYIWPRKFGRSRCGGVCHSFFNSLRTCLWGYLGASLWNCVCQVSMCMCVSLDFVHFLPQKLLSSWGHNCLLL